MIDAAKLVHAKAAAAGATAGSPEQEQKPLVPDLSAAAFLTLQDGMIDELLAKRAPNPDQFTPAA